MSKTGLARRTLPLLVATCWVVSAPAATLADIKQRGFMVVGVAAEASPFGTMVDGKPAGFDADLLNRLRQSFPVEIREKIMPAAALEAGVLKGDIDAVVSSREIPSAPQRNLAFTPPVAEVTFYYLKRRNDGRINSVSDLGGLRFGIRRGPTTFLALTEIEHRIAKAGGVLGASEEFDSDAAAYEALAAHRIDYVVGDLAELAEEAKAKADDFAVGQPVAHQRYVGWLVAASAPDLSEFFRTFLLQERSSGDLAALQRKWLGWTFANLPSEISASDWWSNRDDRPAKLPIPSRRDPD